MAEGLANPFTPLAFLPPDLASQFEVSRYLYAVTLGGYIWDIAVNLPSDYQLLFRHKIRFPTIVYYLSRMFTLSYILTSFVFQVGHVPNCQALQVALGVCNVLAQSSTSMLFYLRVAAVWRGKSAIIAIYTILWLGVVGASITVPVGIDGAHIGTTLQCINTKVSEFTEATAIMALINDSAIFIGITYRILMYSLVDESIASRMKTFFGYGSIPRVSRALLQGGQHYYLIAVCGNIVLLVLVKLPSVPPVYRGMCTIPVIAVINAMACIVFRKIKFGLITSDGTTTFRSTLHGTTSTAHPPGLPPSSTSLPMHYRKNQEGPYALGSKGNAEVQVSKTMVTDQDMPLEVRIMHKGKDGNISAQSLTHEV